MFDAHCHLYDEMFKDLDINKILENARDNGVFAWMICSTDNESMKTALDFCMNHEGCYFGAGYYPCDVKYLEDPKVLNKYLKFLKVNRKHIKVLGEIGLDYYWEKDENLKELQRKWLIYQINLANELQLPICIHCRDAIGDLVQILKEHKPNYGFYMHAYNGSLEITRELLKLGSYFSIGGVVTYKNANNLRECVKEIPLNRLFIETDAPYLPPVPHRGELNLPEFIKLTLEKIAEIKEVSSDELDTILTRNCWDFFKI